MDLGPAISCSLSQKELRAQGYLILLQLSEGWLSIVRLPAKKHKEGLDACLYSSTETPQLSAYRNKHQRC